MNTAPTADTRNSCKEDDAVSHAPQPHPSKKRPALTSITNHFHNEAEAEAEEELKNASSVSSAWVVPVNSREFHPGRYAKLRKLAVLATTVKPPHKSRYYDHTGILILEEWNELVELYALKLQQQQENKTRKEQLKLRNAPPPPAKKKPKSQLPTPVLPPNPRTILPGIQLRTHLRFQEEVASEDGIDFSTPIPAVQHRLFLLQFWHCIVQKAQPPRSYHPLLQRLFPPSSAARKIMQAVPKNVPNVLYHPDRFASRISIHNAVAVSHLVVLELHVRTRNDAASLVQSIGKAPLLLRGRLPPQHFSPSSAAVHNNGGLSPPTVHGFTNHRHHNSNVVVLPTTWYNTNATEPKSITDQLMYHHSEWKLKCHQPGACTIGFIYDQLKPLLLSNEQWEKEEYPPLPPAPRNMIPNESRLSAVVNDKVRDDWQKSRIENRFLRGLLPKGYKKMELKEARQFIQPYEIPPTADETTVTAADGMDDRTNDVVPLLPFVGHCHPGWMDANLKIPPEPPHHERDFFWEYDDFDDSPQKTRRIFAVDCDMVETAMGQELAGVTICEMVFFDQVAKTESVETHKCVHLDSVVVQPYNRMINDLPYSDQSADAHHDNNVLRLEQVQAALLQLIHPCDIVIGHSLANQLHALRFIHPTVVDTALMFHDEGNDTCGNVLLPFKQHSLRHLAAVLLQREIQGSDRTYCCTEDAFAAMELAVLRAVYGPLFCINHTKNNWLTKLPSQIKNPITCVAVGPSQWLRQHDLSPLSSSSNVIQALTCESMDDGNSKAIAGWVTDGPTRRASVVWSKMELSDSSSNNNELIRMNDFVHDVITKLSSDNSVLLVIPIQINYSGTKELHEQRQIRRDDPSTTVPWSEADETQYQTSLEECRNGHVLYITAKG